MQRQKRCNRMKIDTEIAEKYRVSYCDSKMRGKPEKKPPGEQRFKLFPINCRCCANQEIPQIGRRSDTQSFCNQRIWLCKLKMCIHVHHAQGECCPNQ